MSQNFDYGAFYKALHRELLTSTSFAGSMQKMLNWGEKQMPHKAWRDLQALDFDTAVTKVKPWLSRVLKREPCPFQVKGMYFGLGEFANKSGAEYAALYFAMMGQCDMTDKKLGWLWGPLRHYPDKAYLRSDTLKAGGIICNKDEEEDEEYGLSTGGHILFSLSFCALLLKATLDSKVYALLGASEPVGLVLGFDSGDLLRLGSLQATGLVVNADEVSFV